MFEYIADFTELIKTDFCKMFCGKQIGYGVYRQVFEHKYDDSLVIKVEYADTTFFANAQEWAVWKEMSDTDLAKYFAPCVDISENGLILIQKKTKPLRKYPEMIPAFFTDTKRSNYGSINGKFCCHDYASHKLYQTGVTKRMVKANWWD